MDQLKTFGNNIIEKITGYGADKKIKYTKTYLEYRINKFFEKEKLFKKSWLDLYYNFNREFSQIISTPFYIRMFYSNFNYINSCILNSDWDEIMKIYRKVVRDNPNYKNSRLDDPKPIYDRRYILLVTYHIFIIFIYTFGHILYTKISSRFYKIIKMLGVESDYNSTFVVLIAYTSFIIGLYYGGIAFIYGTILLLIKVIYYTLLILYYTIYYIGWIIFIIFKLIGKVLYKTTSAMTGGRSINKKKTLKGGGLYEEFENFMNELRDAVNNLSSDLIINVLNKFFESILPDENTLETQCKSTSNIEKMLARQNSKRNTDEPIDINKKINEKIQEFIPDDIIKTDFARCMLKKTPPPPPPKCT
tara:strand:+ start:707 stop:1789 length:1083 start_codon:yes stop_codon:yes gene_type:complete